MSSVRMAINARFVHFVTLAILLNGVGFVNVGSAEEEPPATVKAIVDRMARLSETETIAVVGLGNTEPKLVAVSPPAPNHCDNLKDQGKACNYTFGGGFVRLGYTPDKRGVVLHRFAGFSCSLLPASLTFAAIFLDSVLEIGDMNRSRLLVRDAVSPSLSKSSGMIRYEKEVPSGWSLFVGGSKHCSFVLEKKAN